MRRLPDWLKGLLTLVENTEAPREFWLWGGLFTIGAALQRKVWLPFGIETIYPNLYVLIVAPPASRKAGPATLAKRMLEDIQSPVAVDSSSKRALTKELKEVNKQCYFTYNGVPRAQAPLAIISKEMSSLLALDPKAMIECLTDLYDNHETWKYKTADKGEDFIYGPCLSCFVLTTPTWITGNLPKEAIGGGYTSRHVILTATDRYKWVPIPPELDPQLYENLVHDLGQINRLIGEFQWKPEARSFYEDWYENRIKDLMKKNRDDRVEAFLGRMHVVALKVAMILHVSSDEDLIINLRDIGRSIEAIERTIPMVTAALSGHGRSDYAPDTSRIMNQIRLLKTVNEKTLMQMNYQHLRLSELREILESIKTMGRISESFTSSGEKIIQWIKGGEE